MFELLTKRGTLEDNLRPANDPRVAIHELHQRLFGLPARDFLEPEALNPGKNRPRDDEVDPDDENDHGANARHHRRNIPLIDRGLHVRANARGAEI